jgi:RNA polymerase sigma factor (sigma-70 family)
MRPRDLLIDQFSTFALLEDDRFRRWIGEPKLVRSMQQQLTNAISPADDRFWAIYWYRQLTHPLAQFHLTAYLQEVCFWVSIEMGRRVQSTQYTLADYFQIANSEIPRVFNSFNPDRSSNFQSYARLVLTNTLRDLVRQQQAADVCSDWSLLRKVSKKRIGEVLAQLGIAAPAIAEYQLAWFCFKQVYVPPDRHSQRLPPPDPLVWSQIVALYNHQLVGSGELLTPDRMAERMTKLARWIRSYLYPALDSLNRRKPAAESGEIQDDLTVVNSESLLDAAIDREEIDRRSSQQSELQTILTQAFANLSPELQEILQLSYRDGLSQPEVAAHCATSGSTIFRRSRQAEAQLLAALLTWRESQLNKLPDPNELKNISTNLRAWLIDRL